MTLQNFPEHFTHTITTEVHADADGHATHVIVRNVGAIPLDALKSIATEAVQSWQGSYMPRHLLLAQDQNEDDVITFKAFPVTVFSSVK